VTARDPRALYHEAIVRLDRDPPNQGPLPSATHSATLDNPLCGDEITIHLAVANATVDRASFEGRGCALSRAGASIAATLAIGASPEQLRALAARVEQLVLGPPQPVPGDPGALAALSAVHAFPSRRTCACLGFRALVRAVDDRDA